jgi:hypothetical protein
LVWDGLHWDKVFFLLIKSIIKLDPSECF